MIGEDLRLHPGRHDREIPGFFWENVEPYIGDALGSLEQTIEGKQWIANLYSHVFTIEHQRRRLGLHLGAKAGERP